MELRAWNLWDTLSGVVERGNAGNSLVWPYALYDDDKPPHPAQLYVATACDASDPLQRWEGATFSSGEPSSIRNVGADLCIDTMACDPVSASACDSEETSAFFVYNGTNRTISVAGKYSVGQNRCPKRGVCFDLNGGLGPDIDLWPCHGPESNDAANQKFSYDPATQAIHPVYADGRETCLALMRSAPLPDAVANDDDPWVGGK